MSTVICILVVLIVIGAIGAAVQSSALKSQGISIRLKASHAIGLPVPPGMQCTIDSYADQIKFTSGTTNITLSRENITDICVKTETEIQQQYVSSAGGAVGGAMLGTVIAGPVVGALAAMFGGRTKKKKTKSISKVLIITYKKAEAEFAYLCFELPDKLSTLQADNLVSEFHRLNRNGATHIALGQVKPKVEVVTGPAESRKYCTQCGNPMDAEMMFCPKCGAKAEEATDGDALPTDKQDEPAAHDSAIPPPLPAVPSTPQPPAPPPIEKSADGAPVGGNTSGAAHYDEPRKGMRNLAIACCVLALIGLFCVDSMELSVFMTVFFGVMTLMFYSLSKSPKRTPYLFGQTQGTRKSVFVVICVFLALMLSGMIGAIVGGIQASKSAEGQPEQTASGNERSAFVQTFCEHKWETVTEKEASCTEAGSSVKHCTSCGKKTKPEAIPASGHNWAETVRPSTCTEAGERVKECSVCGSNEVEAIEAGHQYTETEFKKPGCTTAGMAQLVCSVCGHTEDKILEAVGHTWQDATCTKPKTCSVCGATEGSPAGHTTDAGVCATCKETLKKQSPITIMGMRYSVNSANGVEWTFRIKNNTPKTIKYVILHWTCFNAVDDLIFDEITGESQVRLKFTGPLGGKKTSDRLSNNTPFYNSTFDKVRWDEVSVEFMDGTIEKVTDYHYGFKSDKRK